jgi:hypothetical protein
MHAPLAFPGLTPESPSDPPTVSFTRQCWGTVWRCEVLIPNKTQNSAYADVRAFLIFSITLAVRVSDCASNEGGAVFGQRESGIEGTGGCSWVLFQEHPSDWISSDVKGVKSRI